MLATEAGDVPVYVEMNKNLFKRLFFTILKELTDAN